MRPERKADNLTAICERTNYKMWEPRRLQTAVAPHLYNRLNEVIAAFRATAIFDPEPHAFITNPGISSH
jgi:hypothetical protein